MRGVVTVMLVLRVYLPQVLSFLSHVKLLVTWLWFRHESGWTDGGAVKVMDRPSVSVLAWCQRYVFSLAGFISLLVWRNEASLRVGSSYRSWTSMISSKNYINFVFWLFLHRLWLIRKKLSKVKSRMWGEGLWYFGYKIMFREYAGDICLLGGRTWARGYIDLGFSFLFYFPWPMRTRGLKIFTSANERYGFGKFLVWACCGS